MGAGQSERRYRDQRYATCPTAGPGTTCCGPGGGLACGVAPASAAGAGAGGRPGDSDALTAGRVIGTLTGVAATSAGNACAVGSTNSMEPLILRWNGRAWSRVTSPTPRGGLLNAVAAASSRSAWAVGSLPGRTLI